MSSRFPKTIFPQAAASGLQSIARSGGYTALVEADAATGTYRIRVTGPDGFASEEFAVGKAAGAETRPRGGR